jgi:glycosyltransferase involved in cell wall biosynthesis
LIVRALYVCYLSLDDPLTHSQVVAYLDGLSEAGHEIHLLTFETGRLTRGRRRQLRSGLAARGIRWHGLRYHKRPSLPATIYDTFAGAVVAAWLVRRHRLDAVHARSHVPAAMALLAMRLLRTRAKLIFDIRGLMAEEYVDAGRWKQDGVPFRLTKAVERAAIGRAAGIVVLTERVRRQLFGTQPTPDVWVIPCCADLDALARRPGDRERVRAALGLTDAVVLIYVGKFSGWYMQEEMADFFVAARAIDGRLHFLVLTQGDEAAVRGALGERGVSEDDFTITFAPPAEVGAHLAAADFAISFIRPLPSKASSSPTKVGEYLAAGLPVVATAGIGDLDQVLTPEVSVLVARHDDGGHAAAATRIAVLRHDPATADRCRALSRAQFSLAEIGIPRYRQVYRHVAMLDQRSDSGRPAEPGGA